PHVNVLYSQLRQPPWQLRCYTWWPPAKLSTLSLHDALPISIVQGATSRARPARTERSGEDVMPTTDFNESEWTPEERALFDALPDRKSTRLNSSHLGISYAVFCLKKEIRTRNPLRGRTHLGQ